MKKRKGCKSLEGEFGYSACGKCEHYEKCGKAYAESLLSAVAEYGRHF